MNIEQQVVSLELSKELDRLRVPKKSYWVWNISKEGKVCLVRNTYLSLEKEVSCGCKEYPAYSVAELLNMLTNEQIEKYNEEHHNLPYDLIDLFRSPDRLAEVLIWGIKNNIVKAEEIK